ncbi:methyl-accepting chemotaxis sensory transducer [Carboxydothermus islandicus]|uniref:Methyl-accepting chemotaxis sensory transducer n=1 Tax=Carboxydothermus islandicus TaxID=661089 RepID=A0A1L8D2D4_9THEO|nr:methyl-accepting chemotaxis sensory transducer [Carboxydothermus islandicus]
MIRDEITLLLLKFGKMKKDLTNLIRALKEQVAKVFRLTQDLATNIEQSSIGINDAADGVVKISAAIDGVAQRALSISEKTDKTAVLSQAGEEKLKQMVRQMETLYENALDALTKIEVFVKRSGQIDQIAETIAQIAEQTNLLALNAAIEAARAGEAGKGFGVVAEEVRKLAEQSAESSQEIAKIVRELNAEMSHMQTLIREFSQKTVESKKVVDETAAAFKEILEDINSIDSEIKEMARSAQEVSEASQNIAAATEEQSAILHEIDQSVKQVEEIAEVLNSLAEQFKVGGESHA